ncbi:MAG: M28 family peptidase [Planctomycetota bacterium]|nr:M28 family peptidase [Planctomycetota bacterium]
MKNLSTLCLSLASLTLLTPIGWAQAPASAEPVAPLDMDEVDRYMEHVDFLASPFLGGRLPGTEGMEISKDYVEFYFERAGLAPAVPMEPTGDLDGPGNSWRQPFVLGGKYTVEEATFGIIGQEAFEQGEDFGVPGWGGAGEVSGEAVFVGYGIASGPEDYVGLSKDLDLSGKVAVMLRFEPMGEDGKSLFTKRGWSGKAGLGGKLNAVRKLGASAVLVVNTPGAKDSRIKRLRDKKVFSNTQVDIPVLHVTGDLAQKLLDADGKGLKLEELIERANKGEAVESLDVQLGVDCSMAYKGSTAENVIGVLPGKGELAKEYVMIGAHLDHLGMGDFGSRDRKTAGKVVHPGADDNASGVAALILIAERLKADFDAMPEGAQARSVLFAAFSAEESGLNGAGHYTKNPISPLSDLALMINFDMIGRIENKRLSASALGTGKGLEEFLAGLTDRTDLEVVLEQSTMPASDHWRFVQAEVPVIFGSMENIHDDYHTPRDTSAMIQPEDAVRASMWFHQVLLESSLFEGRFEFQDPQMAGRRTPPSANADSASPGQPKVLFGIQMGESQEGQSGVTISQVTSGGSAARAGIQAGDVLTQWEGKPVQDFPTWYKSLLDAKPGQEVTLTVKRDGKDMELKATLDPR